VRFSHFVGYTARRPAREPDGQRPGPHLSLERAGDVGCQRGPSRWLLSARY